METLVLTDDQVTQLKNTSQLISEGAKVFLKTEYSYLTIFIILFGAIIYFLAEHKRGTAYTTIAFVIGAYTSMLCGWIGMKVATDSNYRTTYSAL